MTKRQIKLTKPVLDFLHSLDGGQSGDVQIHAAVNETLGGYTPLTELNEVLELLDRNGWILTVGSRFKGNLRSLTDAGAAVRLEMR